MPTRIRQLFSVSIFAIVAACLLGSMSAGAAGSRESITLSPVSKKYDVKPGEVVHDTVTIVNDGETEYKFTVFGAPYSVKNGTYDPNYTTPKPNADVYTWITFEQSSYQIAPHETIKVPYTLRVKDNASPGGHYGAILVEVQPDEQQQGQLARKKRVASIVYTTVAGDVQLSGKVNSTNVPWYQSTSPLRADATVQNDGNTDFLATVQYRVSDLLGRVVYNAKNDYSVLPDTTRSLDVRWNNAAWFGIYKVHFSVTMLDNTTTVEKFVLVMPVWLIVLILIAIVFGGVYAISRRSHQTNTPAK